MGSPFGGGNGVTVNIGGTATQLQAAANQAQGALNQVGQAAQQAGTTAGNAMQQAAQQFDQLTQAVKYLQQAQQALGASQAQGDAEFLNQATSAQDYADRLKLLQSSLGLYNAQQQATGAQAEQTGASLNNNLFGRTTSWLISFNQLMDAGRNFIGILQQVGSVAGSLTNTFTFGLPSAIGASLDALMQLPTQALGMLEQYGVPLGPQGIAASFDLNKTTEKTRVGWGYLFGGGGKLQTSGPLAGQIVDPSGTAQQMMQWSSQESMNVPFTRQDMMAAMTSLGMVSRDKNGNHLTASQVEQYLPVLSDIAATYGSSAYGGQGVNLTQAAQAVRMASEGSARMLKWDLNINPDELLKYGLNATGSGMGLHINDPSTLMPALEAFAKAHGVLGASATMESGTFSGEWSSFVDRLQNFGLQAGGTNLDGTIRQGSMFSNLKNDLNDVSGWMSQNADKVSKLADTVAPLMGAGVSMGTSVLGGVFQGMSTGGVGNELIDGLTKFGQFINSPETRNNLNMIGVVFGQMVGPAFKDIGSGVQAFAEGMQKSGIGSTILDTMKQLGEFISQPSTQEGFQKLGTTLADVVAPALKTADTAITSIVTHLNGSDNASKLLDDLDRFGKWMGSSNTQSQFASIGGAVGTLFGYFSGTAVALIGIILEQFKDLVKMIADVVKLAGDLKNGDWKAVASDLGNIKDDALDAANAILKAGQIMLQIPGMSGDSSGSTPAPYGVGALPPNYKPPVLTPAQQAVMARQQRIQDAQDASALSTASGIQLPDAAALTAQGTQGGTAYLAGFQTALSGTGSNSATNTVNAYVAAFQAKIANAGDPLAQSIAQYVDQAVKQQISTALNGYAPGLANGANGGNSVFTPGGFRPHAGLGTRPGGW